MGDQRLPPEARLRHRRDFQRVFEHGTKQVSSAFVVYLLPTDQPRSRLGMAVSKRVGGAVVRNRVKRRTREWFRRAQSELQPPCDIVVVARRPASELPYAESAALFLSLWRRHWRKQSSP